MFVPQLKERGFETSFPNSVCNNFVADGQQMKLMDNANYNYAFAVQKWKWL